MDEERFADAVQARLRRRRLELNLSQEQVATKARLSLRRYQEFEGRPGPNRRFNPTLNTLVRLAHALETDLATLLREPHAP